LVVPLTAPLFLVSATLPGNRTSDLPLPPHELALLATAAMLLLRAVVGSLGRISTGADRPADIRHISAWLRRAAVVHAPEGLFLVAGLLGLWLAVPDPDAQRDALRAFRWFIVEPLIFMALIRVYANRPGAAGASFTRRLATVFVLSGAIVGLIGLLQFAGYDLAVRLGISAAPAHAVGIGIVRGVTSVYGNPNNLGLYLGRVWPVAAALAMGCTKNEQQRRANKAARSQSLFFGLCSLLCLGGILVSFSRGAWVGAVAALIVLMLPHRSWRLRRWRFVAPSVMIAALVLVIGLIFALRGGVAGGSTSVRLLFWRESLQLIWHHPLGLGLDQFFYYHHPAYGRSYIDPTLATTQERYARQPHDLGFELWLNLGPAGLLAVAWLLIRCIRQAHTWQRQPLITADALLIRGTVAALAAALAHGTVDTLYFWPDLAIAFWLLVALIETTSTRTPASSSASRPPPT
jgi:hypothetical protein